VNTLLARWIVALLGFGLVAGMIGMVSSHHESGRLRTSAPAPGRSATATTNRRAPAPSRPAVAPIPAPPTSVVGAEAKAPSSAGRDPASAAAAPQDAPQLISYTADVPPPPPAPPSLPEVAIYGDSLTVLSSAHYHEIADGDIDTHEHAFAGASLPDHAAIILQDPINRLVLALGTNDAHRQGAKPWVDFFNQLPSTKCVVWPKPFEGSNEVKLFNAQVLAIIAPHTNVHVIDWNARASQHPEWVGPDHVHYTDEGRIHYAELLKDAALTCP
jgi:hypothetical protein